MSDKRDERQAPPVESSDGSDGNEARPATGFWSRVRRVFGGGKPNPGAATGESVRRGRGKQRDELDSDGPEGGEPPADRKNLARWHAAVSARPSAKP